LGLCPDLKVEGIDYKFLGIISKNREEWAIADLACLRSSITIVPFYDSLGADVIAFVLNQTELTTICCEVKAIDTITKLKKEGKVEHLKALVAFDTVTEEKAQAAKEAGLKVFTFADILSEGKAHVEVVLKEPQPETIYMFCYTSGTTGDPKGAMLSHRCFMSCMYLIDEFAFGVNETDIAISYLPYGHTFEQCIFIFSIVKGFSHGYYGGDPLKLIDDIQELKPTFFCSVPRILNRVFSKVHDTIKTKGGMAEWVFNRAMDTKRVNYEKDASLNHSLYDKIVFKKIREQFGGRVKYMITASAPISAEVLQFYKLALGIHVYECYGQTENCGPATLTHPKDPKGGHVGGVIPSMRIRLRDCPELGYLATDEPPRGEIQFKGTNIFKGYFKNPARTKEALTEDGWVCSGDVGVVFPNGSIKIIDRAKNIFKLSQGEYIAPEKLENIYA